jgi:hypothetical protein
MAMWHQLTSTGYLSGLQIERSTSTSGVGYDRSGLPRLADQMRTIAEATPNEQQPSKLIDQIRANSPESDEDLTPHLRILSGSCACGAVLRRLNFDQHPHRAVETARKISTNPERVLVFTGAFGRASRLPIERSKNEERRAGIRALTLSALL